MEIWKEGSQNDIVYFRSLARKNSQIASQLNKPSGDESSSSAPKKKSLFSFLWEKSSDTDEAATATTPLNDKDEKETEEFFHNLVKDDTDIFSTNSNIAIDSEFLKFKIGVFIQSTSLKFNECFFSREESLLDFTLDRFYFGTHCKGKKKIFDLEIAQIWLKSGFKNSLFSYLLQRLDVE